MNCFNIDIISIIFDHDYEKEIIVGFDQPLLFFLLCLFWEYVFDFEVYGLEFWFERYYFYVHVGVHTILTTNMIDFIMSSKQNISKFEIKLEKLENLTTWNIHVEFDAFSLSSAWL